MADKTADRREFLKRTSKIAGLCLCSAALQPLLNSCEFQDEYPTKLTGIKITINLDDKEDPDGKALKDITLGKGYMLGIMKVYKGVNFGIPVIIAWLAQDKRFVCFSSLCTHGGCFDKESVRPPIKGETPPTIVCSCHGSRYDASNNAKVIQGPSVRALKQYQTYYDTESNILTINF
ncbi:MAG: rieske iron-sulfur protein [Bacteroidota bacterium]|nr:rieske iron-sulfur protein [Bacteroidota bacterium]